MLNCNITYWKESSKNTMIIKSRISNEISNLIFQCSSVKIEKNDNEYLITVDNNNNTYEILLTVDYPFKPPKHIYVNKVNYNKILVISEEKIKKYLFKYYGIKCLCCYSIINNNNWTPIRFLCNIINDIDQVLNIKKNLYIKILCDKIKYKYGFQYLNIEEYLF